MKLSHRQLEECRDDPRAWVRQKLADERPAIYMGYDGVLRLGIHHYHSTNNRGKAVQHTDNLIRNSYDYLTKDVRREETLERLHSYIDWVESQGLLVAADWITISLPLAGDLELGGRIDRLDITEEGIRGLLLYAPPSNWRGEVRMPLLQRSLALSSGRDEDSISVGYQAPDASLLESHCFSSSDIFAAVREAERLATRVNRIRDEESFG